MFAPLCRRGCFSNSKFVNTLQHNISYIPTRSASDVARENQIKAAVAQKKYKAQTKEASIEAETEAAKAMLEVLSLQHWNYMLLPANQKECIGRELCLRSLRVPTYSNTSTIR